MNTYECPICGHALEKGVIHNGRYKLKWISEESDKGPLLSSISKGIVIADSFSKCNTAFYCKNCNKIIIDLVK